jgi:YggT family protein
VSTLLNIVGRLIEIYILVLIARLVLDFVQMFARAWRPRGVVLVLAEVVYSLTDPPLKLLRRLIPPLRIGTISLDLSFLVLIVALQVAASVLANLSASL